MQTSLDSLRKDYEECLSVYQNRLLTTTALTLEQAVIWHGAVAFLQKFAALLTTCTDEATLRARSQKLLTERWILVQKTMACYTTIPQEKISQFCVALASFVDTENQGYYRYLMPTLTRFHNQILCQDLKDSDLDLNQVIITDDAQALIPVDILLYLDQGIENTDALQQPYVTDSQEAMRPLTPAEKQRLQQHSTASDRVLILFEELQTARANTAPNLQKQLKTLAAALKKGSTSTHGGTPDVDGSSAGPAAIEGVKKFFDYWDNLTPREQSRYGKLKGSSNHRRSLKVLVETMKKLDGDCVYMIAQDITAITSTAQKKMLIALEAEFKHAKKELEQAEGFERYSALPSNTLHILLQRKRNITLTSRHFLELIGTSTPEETKKLYQYYKDSLASAPLDIDYFSAMLRHHVSRIDELCTLLQAPLMSALLTTGWDHYFSRFFLPQSAKARRIILRCLKGYPISYENRSRLIQELPREDRAAVCMAWKQPLSRLISSEKQLQEVLALLDTDAQKETFLAEIQDRLTTLLPYNYDEVGVWDKSYVECRLPLFFTLMAAGTLPREILPLTPENLMLLAKKQNLPLEQRYLGFKNLFPGENRLKIFDFFSKGEIKSLLKTAADFSELLTVMPDGHKNRPWLLKRLQRKEFCLSFPQHFSEDERGQWFITFCGKTKISEFIHSFDTLLLVLKFIPSTEQRAILNLAQPQLATYVNSAERLIALLQTCPDDAASILALVKKALFSIVTTPEQLGEVLAYFTDLTSLSNDFKNKLSDFIQYPGELAQLLQPLADEQKAILFAVFKERYAKSLPLFIDVFTCLANDAERILWLSDRSSQDLSLLGHESLIHLLKSINDDKARLHVFTQLYTAQPRCRVVNSIDERVALLTCFAPQQRSDVFKRLASAEEGTAPFSAIDVTKLLGVLSLQELWLSQPTRINTATLQTIRLTELSVENRTELRNRLLVLFCIYTALYQGQHSFFKSSFLPTLKKLNDMEKMLAILQHIKSHPQGRMAQTWRLAEGQTLATLSQQSILFKEIYKIAFARSSFYSRSKLTKKTLFSAAQLATRLDNQPIDFTPLKQHATSGRSAQIISALTKPTAMQWSALQTINRRHLMDVASALSSSGIIIAVCCLNISFIFTPVGAVTLSLTTILLMTLPWGLVALLPAIFTSPILWADKRGREKNLERLSRSVNLEPKEIRKRIAQLDAQQFKQICKDYGDAWREENDSSRLLLDEFSTTNSVETRRSSALEFFDRPSNQGRKMYRCLVETAAAGVPQISTKDPVNLPSP